MTIDLFGFLIRGWIVIALGWVTAAFLVCGLSMLAGDAAMTNPRGARDTMITCLFIWPASLALQIVAWLTSLCWWVFNPTGGLFARVWMVLAQAAHNRWPPQPVVPLRKQEEVQ